MRHRDVVGRALAGAADRSRPLPAAGRPAGPRLRPALALAGRAYLALSAALFLTVTVPARPDPDGWQASHIVFMPRALWERDEDRGMLHPEAWYEAVERGPTPAADADAPAAAGPADAAPAPPAVPTSSLLRFRRDGAGAPGAILAAGHGPGDGAQAGAVVALAAAPPLAAPTGGAGPLANTDRRAWLLPPRAPRAPAARRLTAPDPRLQTDTTIPGCALGGRPAAARRGEETLCI